jgi:DNA-binding SARP family transcriptional activator
MQARWRLSLLGGCELVGPEGAVDLGGKKNLALLSFLVCASLQAQSREKLATLLWGSHFEPQARQNLRQALFRLRRILGPGAITTSGELVSLAADIACDVREFEELLREGSHAALGQATEIYRGELLAGVLIQQEAWSDWVSSERRRLESLALSAMVRFAEEEVAKGNPQSALATVERALTINSLREDAHRVKMRALAEDGRKPEALKQYEQLRALLKRELDIEPDKKTVDLTAEIKRSQGDVKTTPLMVSSIPGKAPSEGGGDGCRDGRAIQCGGRSRPKQRDRNGSGTTTAPVPRHRPLRTDYPGRRRSERTPAADDHVMRTGPGGVPRRDRA